MSETSDNNSLWKRLKTQMTLQEMTISRLKELIATRNSGLGSTAETAALQKQINNYKESIEVISQELSTTQNAVIQNKRHIQELEEDSERLTEENESLRDQNYKLHEKVKMLRKKLLLDLSSTLNSLNDPQ